MLQGFLPLMRLLVGELLCGGGVAQLVHWRLPSRFSRCAQDLLLATTVCRGFVTTPPETAPKEPLLLVSLVDIMSTASLSLRPCSCLLVHTLHHLCPILLASTRIYKSIRLEGSELTSLPERLGLERFPVTGCIAATDKPVMVKCSTTHSKSAHPNHERAERNTPVF